MATQPPGLKHFDCHFQVDKLIDPEDGGPNIGKFEGFASTFGNVDRMDDIMVKGCFEVTLKDHDRRDRQIRMLFQHDRWTLIGGFPISKAKEDDRGLFVEGNVNLDTQAGAEAFSLMKQGVLEDMSIGFIIRDSEMNDGKQLIKEVDLMEISLVTEPANQEAQITAIKSIVDFKDLPLSSGNEALGGDRGMSITEAAAYLWHKDGSSDFKMQIAVYIDGELKAIPKAIFAAAASTQSSTAQIPEGAYPGIIKNIERYYEKMGRESPFEKGFSPDEMKCLGRGDLVKFLRSQPLLSKSGAEYLSQGIMGGSGDQAAEKQADGLRNLRDTLHSLKK